MCGEKLGRVFFLFAGEGSPPHVRGKGVDRKIALLRYGITPACAGKSFPKQRKLDTFQDHPRMCGEKYWRL